ncbi:EutN/CcmL family microcompartment protein [Acetobacterium sp.]|uniref:EutN/CcmL family microcompartment protein n=1 Tax=Acetobacterium sp. TaxID=1872094 RepID=UPI000CC5E8B5|nr:EutN/CcmL family microcompartment protein [Acetobacterium sp.]MDO9491484.1 EutN/CcmL family microcompartment protein [Acetobacterium sp.]PKM75585.1 MAG: ethanolamine utilization protein EutN [Firmicutes bacterium HGW-Firmicutes-17]
MLIGRVVDSIWCTRKEDELRGLKFLKVELLNHHKEMDNPQIIVATDLIGAGIGELVLITNGSSARRTEGLENAPVDAIIIGIIDEKSDCKEGLNE